MEQVTPEEFLGAIWPAKLLTNEYLELRLIDRKINRVTREFFQSVDELLDRAHNVKGHDVYFGVSTRFGTQGKKKDCYRVQTCWLDVDKKTFEQCHFDEPPDFVVRSSSSGFHAYWVLTRPILIRDVQRYEDIEAINRGWAEKFGADVNCVDISRILRVPGTLNYKYNPLVRVRAYAL